MEFIVTRCPSCATMRVPSRLLIIPFIWDHINRGDINLSYVGTNDKLADIFTKPLDEAIF
jgi:hypothetical protein